LNASSSVLSVLVRKATPDKVLDEVMGTGGRPSRRVSIP
jgi:uncharacterized membrane protein